jgi:hypothetical protein
MDVDVKRSRKKGLDVNAVGAMDVSGKTERSGVFS